MQSDIQSRNMGSMNRPSSGLKVAYNVKKIITVIIGIIILILLVVFIASQLSTSLLGNYHIGDGYQAVFVNNETYFGKVTEINDNVLVLDSVYYLQDQQPLQSGPQPKESDLSLIKLGSEIHGPQNQMIIPIASVSYIENLKETSAIVRAISKSSE